MKAMIELRGTITNSVIYFSAPTTIMYSNQFDIDIENLKSLGFDVFVNCRNENMKDNVIFTNCSKKETAEVQIKTQDITAIIKPVCNVEVKIIRDYNLFQWIGFGALSLYRMIKRG